MQRSGKIKLADLNSLLTCILCGGYYIDATTIIECLHSFCRTCIVKYLHTNKYCPTCDVQVHKTKPLDNIRSDQTLQDIVYKLVPGLFKNEMKRRRDFYQKNDAVKGEVPMSSEKRGDVLGGERLIFTPEDVISISLEYCSPCLPFPSPLPQQNEDSSNLLQCDMLPKPVCHRRYLRCPGAIRVAHLKKFLQAKYNLRPCHNIDVMYMHDYLHDEYTLIDLAYIYSWRRNAPLRLFYKIGEIVPRKSSKIKDNLVAKEVPSLSASEEAVSPHVKIILIHADAAPAPSVAAAPSSQVYFQSHPSPPPSPQMATEPDRVGSSKHNCAALPNGQVKMGCAEMSNKLPEHIDIQPDKKSFFDKPTNSAVNINSNLHLTDRHQRKDMKLVHRNKSFPCSAVDRMNGMYRDRRGSLSKRFPPRKLS